MKVVSRELQTLFSVGTLGGLSDGRLLERFAAHREEAAFEALVRRHGPMVWGVCRRLLRDHHDAEDAFQATFLVLARKGHSIAQGELVANWLYGVAYQTAMKARSTRARRRMREGQVTDIPEPEDVSEDHQDDLTEWLDRELSRLPDKFRIPIVLCELEGKTHQEAAEQLGWPIGTVSGRLSRSRAMLADGVPRGMSLSSGSLAMHDAASASIPTNLIDFTIQPQACLRRAQAVTVGDGLSQGLGTDTRSSEGHVARQSQENRPGPDGVGCRWCGHLANEDSAEGTTLPEKGFVATPHEVIKDANVIVTRIEVESLPGAWLEVVADKPDRGGFSLLANGQPDETAHTQITIFADHVEWQAGSTNVLNFMMNIKGGAACSSMSNTGPMPEAKRLADVLTVAIKSGEYKYGVATKLATYKDVTYSLVVKKPG